MSVHVIARCKPFVSRFLAQCGVALAACCLNSLVSEDRACAAEMGLSLTVTPSTRLVRQGDPLLLKIVIENQGSDEASIPLPSRDASSLALMVELKPHTGLFAVAREAGDGACEPVEIPELVLRGRQKLVAYDCLFHYTDSDAVFRQYGQYELYAVIRRGKEDVLKSERITITVSRRAQSMQREVERNLHLVVQALNRRFVYLDPPPKNPSGEDSDRRTRAERIEALENLRLALRREPGTLAPMLEWRIELLRLKYGSEDEQRAAHSRLDEMPQRNDVDAIAKDMMALLMAQVDVGRGDWRAAQRTIRELPDSPEKRNVTALIDNERLKDAASVR